MSAVEVNAAFTEEDQREKMSSPLEEEPQLTHNKPASLNFSELTPHQFGISVQSFTPLSQSNHKDKSRLAQIKARRRSSVGVRGSPETNSLIRFMAQQKMKTPPAFKTPELVKSSPLLPRVASTLRQKMASFQNLMDVEESEGCDPVPKQDSNTGGCIKTRDYLSDGNSRDREKENHPPVVIPSKRRRLGPLESCEVEIREAGAPILHFSLKEHEEEEKQEVQVMTEGPLTSSDTVEKAEAVFLSPSLHVDSELKADSPAETQQDGVFELQSPHHPPPDDPAAASPTQPASILHIPSLPPLLGMKPTGEGDSTGTSTVKKKKKVRFGGPLSPEFFDKNLPPSTPLQKGGTPARAQTPGGSLQLRSLLKTPQGSESQTQKAQLDLGSPTEFGASPTLAIPRNRRTPTVREDREDGGGKIVFPSIEEIDSAVLNDAECTWDIQPLDLNSAFHEECLPQVLTESETEPSAASQLDVLDELGSLPEEETQIEADVEVVQSRRRKRKQPEESEPVKRSTRSAAKSASGRMKSSSAAARRWNKEVDRSLYGSRAYASKNPTLSPITERFSFISQPLLAEQQTLTTAPSTETCLNPEMIDDTQVISNLTTTNVQENPSEDSAPSPVTTKPSVRRPSGRKVRRRGLKEMRVTPAEGMVPCFSEEEERKTEGEKDETTTNSETSREETPLSHAAPEQEGADTEQKAQTSADTPCTESDRKPECLHALTSDCPAMIEEPRNTVFSLPEVTRRKYKQGRRSSMYRAVPQELGNQAEEHQMSCDLQKSGQGDRAAKQEENDCRSSSDGQEEGEAAHMDLAPWQTDFNFEDVFKPVATRGQRSVRRSLRNRRTSDNEGLAWLPWTSPETSKESRRRTRGERRSAALPVQPSVPEETAENKS
ncbi:cell division cycle-associated protein 2 isoform X5 [Xyrichtys novacula]|uniref:Cell division cycle-associated protein 2 isoform X5 n=1 Tax=Xyrichtys novacula TaxID=13765 RepID=A0AAV1G5A6_XYRNO|nr:cell division cycle-associated protein 2 isoform X5 [Xyrichtys novacula]